MNYTPEETEKLKELYLEDPTRDTVDKLAQVFNKSVKSIIGKLSREGVYRREVYKTKSGDNPVTKQELVHNLCETLDLDQDQLTGLEKAPKAVLKLLEEKVKCLPLKNL